MATPSFTVTCRSKKLLLPSIYELRFEKPAGFTFVAGQFVLFDVPLASDPADTQVRAYSIASAPKDGELLFVIKIVPGGRAGAWVRDVLVEGMTVSMKGPLGAFTVDRMTTKPYLFVATGTGIAPFRSQVRSQLYAEGDQRPIHLLWGFVRAGDLFWAEEWRALEKEFPNFHVHISFLDGAPDWHGEAGPVPERAKVLIGTLQPSLYFCGSPELVKVLRESCLSAWGVPKEDVHVESFL